LEATAIITAQENYDRFIFSLFSKLLIINLKKLETKSVIHNDFSFIDQPFDRVVTRRQPSPSSLFTFVKLCNQVLNNQMPPKKPGSAQNPKRKRKSDKDEEEEEVEDLDDSENNSSPNKKQNANQVSKPNPKPKPKPKPKSTPSPRSNNDMEAFASTPSAQTLVSPAPSPSEQNLRMGSNNTDIPMTPDTQSESQLPSDTPESPQMETQQEIPRININVEEVRMKLLAEKRQTELENKKEELLAKEGINNLLKERSNLLFEFLVSKGIVEAQIHTIIETNKDHLLKKEPIPGYEAFTYANLLSQEADVIEFFTNMAIPDSHFVSILNVPVVTMSTIYSTFCNGNFGKGPITDFIRYIPKAKRIDLVFYSDEDAKRARQYSGPLGNGSTKAASSIYFYRIIIISENVLAWSEASLRLVLSQYVLEEDIENFNINPGKRCISVYLANPFSWFKLLKEDVISAGNPNIPVLKIIHSLAETSDRSIFKLLIKPIPIYPNWGKIKEIFSKKGVSVKVTAVKRDQDTNSSRRQGFITITGKDQYVLALSLHGISIRGETLQILDAKAEEARIKAQNRQAY